MFGWIYRLYCRIPYRERSLAYRWSTRAIEAAVPWMLRLRLSRPHLRNGHRRVIVSLTSFPARIHLVDRVVESILYGNVHPDAIVLWLSQDEFPSESTLPPALRALQRRGLTITLVPGNLKPHKKYLYAFSAYPDHHVITIDDDALYPPSLVHDLLAHHHHYPNTIIATRARRIIVQGERFAPYRTWSSVVGLHPPSEHLLPVGVGGVFYPAGSLSGRTFDHTMIESIALHADDLWLKFANENRAIKTICVGSTASRRTIPIRAALNTAALSDQNVTQSHNDIVLQRLLDARIVDLDRYR
ncbi:MAG: hypothetical protein RLZZ63_326 [Gemmatimonadota bacterium]